MQKFEEPCFHIFLKKKRVKNHGYNKNKILGGKYGADELCDYRRRNDLSNP